MWASELDHGRSWLGMGESVIWGRARKDKSKPAEAVWWSAQCSAGTPLVLVSVWM